MSAGCILDKEPLGIQQIILTSMISEGFLPQLGFGNANKFLDSISAAIRSFAAAKPELLSTHDGGGVPAYYR